MSKTAKHTTGVFGLGSMGYGMATNMHKSGISVHGFDVDQGKVDKFQAEGGEAGSLGEVAAKFDSVLLVVVNAKQTEEVLFGDGGVADKLTPGTVIISCATLAPDFAAKMEHRSHEAKMLYLDAPISGGSLKAASGDLSVMASGRKEAFAAAKQPLDAIAAKIFELGDKAGPGSAMKAINQLLAGTQIATMAEAMTFGISQGIDPETFMEVIPQCAGTSWILENRGPHVVDNNYQPRSMIDIWPKDLGIVLDIAKNSKFSAPMAAAALQQFLAASGSGLGSEDDAALVKVYARNAGLKLPGE